MPIESTNRLPESFLEYSGETLMSNYDGLINDVTADEIKGEHLFSRYAAWDFNGKVWWKNNQWNCEVWQYGSFIETISRPTLPELMEVVGDKYGHI